MQNINYLLFFLIVAFIIHCSVKNNLQPIFVLLGSTILISFFTSNVLIIFSIPFLLSLASVHITEEFKSKKRKKKKEKSSKEKESSSKEEETSSDAVSGDDDGDNEEEEEEE